MMSRVLLSVAALAGTASAVENNAYFFNIFLGVEDFDVFDFQTNVPWGQVATDGTTGHCSSNSCIGNNTCFDHALTEELDRDAASVAAPSVYTSDHSWVELVNMMEDLFDEGFSNATAVEEFTDIIENGERLDFYQNLEDFACCDCSDCMRLSDCYRNITNIPGLFTCADAFRLVSPASSTKEELAWYLDQFNLGGCYWCPALQAGLDDSYALSIVQMAQYDFQYPTPTTTTTTTTEYTTTTTTTTTTETTCRAIGCGNETEVCSCKIDCEANEETECCDDYEEANCPVICPSESYSVLEIENEEEQNTHNCDDILNLYGLSDDEHRFTCEELENLYGLNCAGCSCAEPPEAPAPAPIGECEDEDANCGYGWVEPMSCQSLIEASEMAEFETTLTCASLEGLGCNCDGCPCEREPVCTGAVDNSPLPSDILCMGGKSCNYWAQRLPDMTCEILESDYGCNCDYCDCDASVPESTTPEPGCACEVNYAFGDCDSFGALAGLGEDSLCCGVMEHIFQMDCTGCCCESSGCDTCLSNTTTTMTTTTTVDCPDDLDYYYDCEYLLDCYDGSENPTTDHVLKTYDCKWIKEWMSEPTICFDFFGADCDPINNNTECSGSQTCEPSDFGGNTCQSCYANIPGAEVETTTEKPCYYFDHYGVGDRNYSAYDCVEDYENGDGCIYIDAILDNSPTSGETGCEILLDNVNCPNPPEDCTCVAEWIFTSSCDVPCGGGGRDSLYTCVDPNCEFECVSDAFYPVGEVSEPQCNTHLCSSVVCETDLIGDGYCDFSYQLNYVIQYNDGSADSVNNNLDFCDWDGGDCCAQSCEPDDTTLVTFGRRGDNCAFAGGGCIDVPTDIKDDVETLIFQTWFNPGAQSGGTDPTCTQVGADSWDCCMPIVMFDNADEPSFQCEYGGVTHDKCALPSGRCLDPQYGTSSSSTTSTTSTSTTTS